MFVTIVGLLVLAAVVAVWVFYASATTALYMFGGVLDVEQLSMDLDRCGVGVACDSAHSNWGRRSVGGLLLGMEKDMKIPIGMMLTQTGRDRAWEAARKNGSNKEKVTKPVSTKSKS